MDNQPSFENRVVGVFRDRARAEEAAQAARHASNLRQNQIRFDAQEDQRFALRGEMREEVDHTIAGPGPVGPYTKEMTKGLVRALAIWIPIGIAVALPIALIPIGQTSLAFRLVLWGIVGGVAAGVAALAISGGLSAKSPGVPLAAERGVTVGVIAEGPDQARAVADALAKLDPIRLEAGVAERPTGMVAREPEDDEA
jgi:hypothetical protein